MGSINLTKLQPGRSYSVVVRAVDGSGEISQNSLIYNFTVPSTNTDGTQLTSTNSAVVTALAPSSSSVTGGALIAGGLDLNGAANSGALNLGSVWNNTASSIAKLTGTASTGAVVINSTGILGYQLTSTSSGQANFFLDTASGNAYFRGTVYANAGQIGGFLINNSSLSASTFFNKLTAYDPSFEDQWKNYWTASADYFGNMDMSLLLINDETLNPIQAGLRYARFSVSAFGNGLPNISGSSMEMTMFKTASSKIAFSQSDLGISSGSTYTLSVYVQDLGSETLAGASITFKPAKIYLKINKYSASGTSSATFISSQVSGIFTTSSTTWTRISGSFTTSSAEYYTFSIINAESYIPPSSGTARSVGSSIAVDAIQLEPGNTANNFGFDNYFAVNPADSTKPINLSSINNSGSTSNIFSVYTDGGTYANYFFSNKQSRIGSVYFGGTGSTNISIGDYYATHNQPDGNNVNVGIWSLGFLTSGSNNVAIGYYAGKNLQYGSNNIFIGKYNLSSELSGSAGGLTPVNNSIFISDGAGNLRIKSDSSGLVSIPGSASISGSAYLSGNLTASGTITAASFVGDGSGLTGITASGGSGTGSITIGSTVIPLNTTTASLSGLSTFDLTNNATSSGTIFLVSSQAGTGQTGGIININTDANASGVSGTSTGGAINIKTTATQSGATAVATSGAITISTQGSGTGTFGSTGGNILITTTKSGTNSTAGNITITSNKNFTISTGIGNTGTIDNFNIGATTPGTGNFSSLSISGSAVSTQAYADSASLNAYNSASTYTQSSAWNNTSASVKYASSAGFVSGSNVSGTVASATYSSSAGYLPVSGLSASTITIGSTSIGLGNTSASLSGLSSLFLSATSGSTTLFSATNTVTNSTGGAITLSTTGNANGVGGSGTGGAISITTNATQTGTTAGAQGGAITINTDSNASGIGGTNGGNIIISTTKGGANSVAGSINITSNAAFTILANTNVGAIDNFNIGATTAGTGKFTTLNATGATNGTTASYTGQVNANNLVLSSSLTAISASLSGRVTASAFSGDGSALTNLSASSINAANITSMQVLTSQTTSTTGSTLYPIFPASTQGIALKANTVYYFEGFLSLTKQASTLGGNWSIAASFTNAPQSFYWNLTFTGNNATAATLSGAIVTTASALNMGTAGTANSTGLIKFQGYFQTNATTGGSLQPQFAQSATPLSGNPTANAGSYFRITEQGTAYPVVSGSWGP